MDTRRKIVVSLAVGAVVLGGGTAASAFHTPLPTQLNVTYRATPEVAPVTWSVGCLDADSDPGDADTYSATACSRLARTSGDPFQPVPPGTMCTQVWGGPETARITGWWRSRPVDASFSRRNGCEISRWDNLVPILPGIGSDVPKQDPGK